MRFSMKSAVIATAVATLGLFASAAHADNLAYWNFNDFTATAVDSTARTAAFTADGGVNVGSATMSTSFLTTDGASSGNIGITHFAGSTINSLGGDPTGQQSLALQGSNASTGTPNNGQTLTFGVSTVGFNAVNVSFATQRSGTSGFNANQFAYSLDGVNFVDFGAAYAPATAFALQSFDLSSIAGLNNNANAAFRITFTGATASSGNNRIDNLIIAGTGTAVVPEAGTLALIAPALGVLGAVVVRRRKTA